MPFGSCARIEVGKRDLQHWVDNDNELRDATGRSCKLCRGAGNIGLIQALRAQVGLQEAIMVTHDLPTRKVLMWTNRTLHPLCSTYI